MKNNKGYVLILNLILITLISLFIPLLMQKQRLSFKILNNRKLALKNKAAVESALEYQYYLLEKNNILCDENFKFKDDVEIKIKGKELEDVYLIKAESQNENPLLAEMKIEKESLKIVNKKLYRSD